MNAPKDVLAVMDEGIHALAFLPGGDAIAARNALIIARADVADLIAAARGVITTFAVLGRDRALTPPPSMVRECEQAMLALSAATTATRCGVTP